MDAGRRQELESQLSAYIDGELTDEERAEVEAFLAQDAQARLLLTELRATVAGLRSLPRAKASGDLTAGLRSRLERRALLGTDQTTSAVPSAASPFSARWLAAAAVIALAVVAGIVMWSFTEQEQHRAGNQFAMRKPAEAPPRSADRQEGRLRISSKSRHVAPKERVLADGLDEDGTRVLTPAPNQDMVRIHHADDSRGTEKVAELGIATAPAGSARVALSKETPALRVRRMVASRPREGLSERKSYFANRPVKLAEEWAAPALAVDDAQSPATSPATMPCRAASLRPSSTRPAASTGPAPQTQPATTSLPSR